MEENILIKAFEFKQINDNEMRKFECWGSVEVVDRHNEIIAAEDIYKIMDIWMDRGAPIQYMHTNRNVGKGLNWQKADKNGKPGVLITGMIYKHYAEDDQVWEDIKKNKYEGLSIGGKSFKREITENGTYLKDLIGYEFSLVDRTGNQEATFVGVNAMAKGKQINKEEEQVMDENPDTSSEDRMSQIENILTSLVDKIAMIEEKIAGKPESEEEQQVENQEEPEVEETKKSDNEEPTEEIQEEPKEDVTKKLQEQISEQKKELADLKKSIVAKSIKTERPKENSETKTDKYSEVSKAVDEMAKKGKIDFAEIGRLVRG